MQLVKDWLNGTKEYWTGVFLYKKYGTDKAFLIALNKGKTDFLYQRLQKDLKAIVEAENKKQAAPSATTTPTIQPKISPLVKKDYSDTPLYIACKKEADLLYKQVMNDRALLFASFDINGLDDVNAPDKVLQRSKPAIDVIIGYRRLSKLYEKADFVKLNGRLPNDVPDEDDEINVDGIPDHLVKQKLDNARKNFNKMDKREKTPERIDLLEKNSKLIKQLEARWQSLK